MPTESDILSDHLSADQVAIQLGITIPSLRKLRREVLREGEHWVRDPQDDRRTLFSPSGIDRIRGALSGAVLEAPAAASTQPMPTEAEKSPAAPVEAPEAVANEEVLTVVSSPRVFPSGEIKHHPNPRVISARRSNGEVVYVRVSESRHFIAKLRDGSPMTLKARLDGNPPNWSLVGRCPRYLGRW